MSLETSFLADEGASLPKPTVGSSISLLERTSIDSTISVIPTSYAPTAYSEVADLRSFNEESAGLNLKLRERESVLEPLDPQFTSSPNSVEYRVGSSDVLNDRSTSTEALEEYRLGVVYTFERRNLDDSQMTISHTQAQDLFSQKKLEEVVAIDASSEYHSAGDSHQSILVSFSSRCVLNGSVCERSRLLRIKFYGCFDKPLGRYLQDDLFDQVTISVLISFSYNYISIVLYNMDY